MYMCGVDRSEASFSLIFHKIFDMVLGFYSLSSPIRYVCQSFLPQGHLARGNVGWGE